MTPSGHCHIDLQNDTASVHCHIDLQNDTASEHCRTDLSGDTAGADGMGTDLEAVQVPLFNRTETDGTFRHVLVLGCVLGTGCPQGLVHIFHRLLGFFNAVLWS